MLLEILFKLKEMYVTNRRGLDYLVQRRSQELGLVGGRKYHSAKRLVTVRHVGFFFSREVRFF